MKYNRNILFKLTFLIISVLFDAHVSKTLFEFSYSWSFSHVVYIKSSKRMLIMIVLIRVILSFENVRLNNNLEISTAVYMILLVDCISVLL